MDKIDINVYTNIDNKPETNSLKALKNNNTITYFDLNNNKMIIDLKNEILERENIDYHFIFKFKENKIIIKLKKDKLEFIKEIETLNLSITRNSFNVKYRLNDENIINEYIVKF